MKIPGLIAVGLTVFFVQIVFVRAVYISGCPQEVVENSADVRITCTGILPSHQVVWQYQPAGHRSSDVGTCNPLPVQCLNKLSNLMTVSRTSETSSVLTIANATRELFSEAAFTCSTFYRSSLSGSTSCGLNVIYPPEMISFSVNKRHGTVTVNESDGEALTLACIAGGNPTPQLTLFKNERILRTVTNSSIPEKKTTALHFNVPQSCASTGRYVCVANNTAGQQQKSLFLEVLCGPRPTFPMIPTRELSVETNLTVYITAVPPPHIFNIVRLRNGTEPAFTPENIDDFHIQCNNITLSNHVCTLKVDYVTEEEEGEYALDVSNDVRHCRFPFHLSAVHSKPSQVSFLINNFNMSVSMNESTAALPMVCTASGSPRPDLTLKKGNITMKEEQGSQSRDRKSTSLEYAVMASCDSNGVYTCVASNSAGTAQISSTVEVFCTPSFQADMAQAPIVSVNRSWTFHVTALPSPDLLEFVGLQKRTNRTNTPLLHVECSPVKGAQHRCVVSVFEPTLDDKGDYTLTVGNSLGKITLPFHLDVPEERNPEKETALFSRHQEHSESSLFDLFIAAISVPVLLIIGHILLGFILVLWRMRKKRNKNATTGSAHPLQSVFVIPGGPPTPRNPLVLAVHEQGVTHNHADDFFLCNVENVSEPSTARSSRTSTLSNGVRPPSGQVATSSPASSHRDRSITYPKRVSESAAATEQKPRSSPSVPANGPGPQATGSDEAAEPHEISPTRDITELSDTGDQQQGKTGYEHTGDIHINNGTKRADCNPQYVPPETLFLGSKLTIGGVSNPCFDETEA